MSRRRSGWSRSIAFGVAGMLTWGVLGSGAQVAAAGSPPQVIIGNLEVAFGGQPQTGQIIAEGNGMVVINPGFNLESGKETGGWGTTDLKFGTSGGQPTLSGNLEVMPANGTLASPPSGNTVPATPGTELLVLDNAGNYAIVAILAATPQMAKFQYLMQSSVAILQQPKPTPTPTPTPTPQPPSPPTPAPASQGAYDMPSNCVTVNDSSGNADLQGVVIVTPMFSGQTVQSAQAEGQELVLNVGLSAPTDVASVKVQQSGGQYGAPPWTLQPISHSAKLWQFSLQETDETIPYQILITSPTLAADGIADPATGVTELDWHFNTTQGCGSSETGQAQGGTSSSPSSTTGASGGQTGTPSSGSSSSGNGSQTGTPAAQGGTDTIALQIGSGSAMVNGAAQPIDVPPQIIGGRTMVPLRFLASALGAQVSWDGTTRTVTYTLGSTQVVLQIGNSQAQVDDQPVSLDVPPTIVGGRTLVPVRFVSQELGASVSWDPSTQTVAVTYPAASSSTGSSASGTASGTSSSGTASSGSTSSAGSTGGGGSSASPSGPASQYECGSFNISSGGAGSCNTLPWIKLGSDGSYTWGSDSGTYQYAGGQITFSGSLGGWGAGQLNASGQIVFRFSENGSQYIVIYYPH